VVSPGGIGEVVVEGATRPLTFILVRRLAKAEGFFSGGEKTVDVRLDIRGIFVGVSLMIPDEEFVNEGGS
jgi:hypothetical protein